MLEGKAGAVGGCADERGVAWGMAGELEEGGGGVVLNCQGERTEGDVRKRAATLTHRAGVVPMDVQEDAQITAAVDAAASSLGGIDILVHAVAYARPDDLGGRFVDTSREGFHLALDVSSYSLAALAREVEPHMRARGGGSSMALSYIASDRAGPGGDGSAVP